ncbi:MAG: 4-(cytidine 5'-diphospho)-2-C-methyl-D-erythritol kinase [Clostridia bacterium]|nr:4-(cytidine 5'-diphospho)-2-C-methyl-D-erythritol kinase [Clostridia bacterium]
MKNYKKITAYANAKINLELDVLGKRPDGYHNISTVFQSISLCDEITVEVSDGDEITALTEGAVIEGENLVTKAACIFLSEIKKSAFVKIKIKKNIPLSAGLAGGSTNAAAVLLALNHYYNNPLSETKLLSLALKLGADVPFCLLGGTYLAEGIGEELSPLNYIGEYDVILIKHHKKGSTGEMYSRIDNLSLPRLNPNESLLTNLNLENIFPHLSYNSFLYASDDAKEQEKICNLLLQKGAILSGLSGSGPTLFGIFKSIPNGLIDYLKDNYKEVYICKTANSSIKIIE